MNYFKTFETYLNPLEKDFSEKIDKWNENFSSIFIFQKNKALVPSDLETSEVDGRNGATHDNVIQIALNNLANILVEFPLFGVAINVHTDSTQPNTNEWKDNDELSQARADNIKNYLTSKGAKAEKIKAIGKGFSEPLIEDESDDNEAKKNKRVIITNDN
jgi:hypothetical protein